MIYYTTNYLSRNGCIAIYSFESGCAYTFGDKNGSCSPFVCPKSKGLALSDKLSNCAPRVRPINPDRQRDKTKYPREGYSLAGAEPDRSLILRQGRLEKAQITQN